MKEFVTQLVSYSPSLSISQGVSAKYRASFSLTVSLFFSHVSLSLSLPRFFPTPSHTISSSLYNLPSMGLSSWVAVFPKKMGPFWPIFLVRWDLLHISELIPLELVPASKSMLNKRISPRHYITFLVLPWVGLYYTMLEPSITYSEWLGWTWLMGASALDQYLIYGPYRNHASTLYQVHMHEIINQIIWNIWVYIIMIKIVIYFRIGPIQLSRQLFG